MSRRRLDRAGLQKLMRLMPKTELALAFGISLPTIRRYCRGGEPKSEAATESVNRQIEMLLNKFKKQAHQHPEWRDPEHKIL